MLKLCVELGVYKINTVKTKIKISHIFIICICCVFLFCNVVITAARNLEYLSSVVTIESQEDTQDNQDCENENVENEPEPVAQTPIDWLAKMSSDNAKLAAKNIKTLGLTSKNLIVPLLYQNPTLPSGCEAVALTNQLKYYGFSLELTTIVDTYMPYSTEDWVNAYVGSPYGYYGVTIMAPGITTTANNFLRAVQPGLTGSTGSETADNNINSTYFYAYDVSGQNFEELFKYVERGHPVQIWVTHCMQDPGYINASIDEYKFYELEHCVLLSGFKRSAHTVKITDSIYGETEYNIDKVANVYNLLNKQAVVILTNKEVNAFLEGKDASYDGSVEAAQDVASAVKAAEENSAQE